MRETATPFGRLDSLALARAYAGHIQCPKVTGRVKLPAVMPMYRYVEHIRIVPECSLSSVAMMDIPYR